jgi:hypothetical protein
MILVLFQEMSSPRPEGELDIGSIATVSNPDRRSLPEHWIANGRKRLWTKRAENKEPSDQIGGPEIEDAQAKPKPLIARLT